jgi:diguanylate cyclase (GGDEF)-like protein
MGGKWLYVLILVLGDPSDAYEADDGRSETKAQSFDYAFQSDYLTIRLRNPDGSVEEHGCDHWMSKLDGDNDKIAPGSTARLSAMVRDLRSHPSTGFVDIKCVLRPELGMRWYHVNYKCEADENGRATVVHAYARDANDQMGSARWWRQQAETDQLTGLANRNTIEQEINFAVHTQGGGMMFMVDLDGFKRVNDELGHLAGDALLRDIAVALRDSLRDGDVLGRYGGDEFVAFVPHAGRPDLELVVRRAQQLIDAVAQVRAADGSEAACSVGVAVFASRDVTFYNLLEVADRALYQSKNRGKGIYTVLEV